LIDLIVVEFGLFVLIVARLVVFAVGLVVFVD
jgi:hypothetical protein